MRILERQDLADILHGSAILGAGGGGDLSEGFELIDAALDAGKRFELVSIDDVPDDAVVATPYMLGAISPPDPEEERQYARLPRAEKHPILLAYERFQTHLGTSFFGAVPCEMGGSNTAIAFFAAAMNGHKVLDADPAGRAVPEIQHSTYYLCGLPASPIFAANAFGETMVLEGIADDVRAETLVRALSRVSRHDIAAIDHALPMADLRPALIAGTISKALVLGQSLRRATERREDAAEAIAAAGNGVVAFRGRVTESHHDTVDGFTLGRFVVAGDGAYDGETCTVSLKNENLVAWRGDTVLATVPDLICLFDRETNAPLVNPDVTVGQSVTIIFLPAPEEFTTEAGLAVFGPAYAGVNQPYRPFVRNP